MASMSDLNNILKDYPVWSSIFTAFISSGALTWISKEWLSSRIKSSVSHEYSERLQEHKREMDRDLQKQKGEFDTQLLKIRMEHEVAQTRTSLFFEYQRTAFIELNSSMIALLDEWSESYDPVENELPSAPQDKRLAVKKLYYTHQLFLAPDSASSMRLLFMIYEDSTRDSHKSYQAAGYLQPRITALFQKKLGASYDPDAIRQLALLGIIIVVAKFPRMGENAPTDTFTSFLLKLEHNIDYTISVGLRNFEKVAAIIEERLSITSYPDFMTDDSRNLLRTFKQMLENPQAA